MTKQEGSTAPAIKPPDSSSRPSKAESHQGSSKQRDFQRNTAGQAGGTLTTARPNQVQVYVSAEDRRERVSEFLDVIEHYVSIARSCNTIGDNQMLVDAFRNLENNAIHGSKAVRMLLAAIAADKRLGEFCRGDITGNDRHDG